MFLTFPLIDATVVDAGFHDEMGDFVVDFDAYVFFEGDVPTQTEVLSAMTNTDFLFFITDYVWNTTDIFNTTQAVLLRERESTRR